MYVRDSLASPAPGSILMAQVAMPVPMEPPAGLGVGLGDPLAAPPIGRPGSADVFTALLALRELAAAHPDKLKADFERALRDAGKANAGGGGEFTLTMASPLPFMAATERTVRVSSTGLLTLVQPSNTERPDVVLGTLGNVRDFVADGVSLKRYPTLARTIAPGLFQPRGVPGSAIVATALALVQSRPDALGEMQDQLSKWRDALILSNAVPARPGTSRLHETTSGSLAPTSSGASAPVDYPTIQRLAAQGSEAAARSVEPLLKELTQARDATFAELRQLVVKTGPQPELVQRAEGIGRQMTQIAVDADRYTALVGGQHALLRLALPGLADVDGSVLTQHNIGPKVGDAKGRLLSAVGRLDQSIGFLAAGVHGQQNKAAAQRYDEQAKAVSQTLAAMAVRLEQAGVAATAPAGAKNAVAAMQVARSGYAAHARAWLSLEYARSLVNTGFTGPIRDAAGHAVDRRIIDRDAKALHAALQTDVVGFEDALLRLASPLKPLASAPATGDSNRSAPSRTAALIFGALQQLGQGQVPTDTTSRQVLLGRALAQAAASQPGNSAAKRIDNLLTQLGLPPGLATERFASGGDDAPGPSAADPTGRPGKPRPPHIPDPFNVALGILAVTVLSALAVHQPAWVRTIIELAPIGGGEEKMIGELGEGARLNSLLREGETIRNGEIVLKDGSAITAAAREAELGVTNDGRIDLRHQRKLSNAEEAFNDAQRAYFSPKGSLIKVGQANYSAEELEKRIFDDYQKRFLDKAGQYKGGPQEFKRQADAKRFVEQHLGRQTATEDESLTVFRKKLASELNIERDHAAFGIEDPKSALPVHAKPLPTDSDIREAKKSLQNIPGVEVYDFSQPDAEGFLTARVRPTPELLDKLPLVGGHRALTPQQVEAINGIDKQYDQNIFSTIPEVHVRLTADTPPAKPLYEAKVPEGKPGGGDANVNANKRSAQGGNAGSPELHAQRPRDVLNLGKGASGDGIKFFSPDSRVARELSSIGPDSSVQQIVETMVDVRREMGLVSTRQQGKNLAAIVLRSRRGDPPVFIASSAGSDIRIDLSDRLIGAGQSSALDTRQPGIFTQNPAGQLANRAGDAERTLLESVQQLVRKSGGNPADYDISIVSEQSACASCQSAIDQMKELGYSVQLHSSPFPSSGQLRREYPITP